MDSNELQAAQEFKDPIRFVKLLWPDIILYKQQREIMYRVLDSSEVFVVAGNMLG